MNKTLTLTIVIPAYNEAVHLKACLDAIAAQTVPADEVIVVDNNSTDATAAVAGQYPFVRLIREHKQGIVYARDAGFDAASGDIIGRIDADTILKPGWVKRIKAFYADPAHGRYAVSGRGDYYNLRWPRAVGAVQHVIVFGLNRLIMGHHMAWGSNMALPKSAWQTVRGQVCHRPDIHEDIDLAIHLPRCGYHVTYRKSLRVGVEMRRVHDKRRTLWPYLMWWPRTLRVHGYKTWVLAWLGALMLYTMVPGALLAEKLATAAGRPGLRHR